MDISIIIATYKPEEYLIQCLDSIQNQTLEKNRYEVIIVLNGCDNPWKDWLEKSLEKYTFAYQFIQTMVGGVSNARNIALEKVSSSYVTFIDDDDWFSNEYLEEMLCHATPKTIVHGLMLDSNESDGAISKGYVACYWEKFKDRGYSNFLEGRGLLSSVGAKLIPMEVIGDRRFDVRIPLGEDALFMTSLIDKIDNITITKDRAIYYRRLRNGSASRRTRSFWERLHIVIMLCSSYIGLYFRHPGHYPIGMILARVLVTPRRWLL